MESRWYLPIGVLNNFNPTAEICQKNLNIQLKYIFNVYLNYECFSSLTHIKKSFDNLLKNCKLPADLQLIDFENKELFVENPFQSIFETKELLFNIFATSMNIYFSKQLNLGLYPLLNDLLKTVNNKDNLKIQLNMIEREIKSRKAGSLQKINFNNVFECLKNDLCSLWDSLQEKNEELQQEDICEFVDEKEKIIICNEVEDVRERKGLILQRRSSGKKKTSLQNIKNCQLKIQDIPLRQFDNIDAVLITDFSFSSVKSKELSAMTGIHKKRLAVYQIENLQCKYLYRHLKDHIQKTEKICFYIRDHNQMHDMMEKLILTFKNNLHKIYILQGYFSRYDKHWMGKNFSVIPLDEKLQASMNQIGRKIPSILQPLFMKTIINFLLSS